MISSFPKRSVPIFVSANPQIYQCMCTHNTHNFPMHSVVYYEFNIYILIKLMRTISHFSSHNHVFMCVSICVFTCVGWVCMHGGLKRARKPLELQLCLLWNACLVMWVLGPELQSSWLQKCYLLLSRLSSPLSILLKVSVWRKSQGISIFPFWHACL